MSNGSINTLLYENLLPFRVVKRARGFESSRIGLIVGFDFKRHFPAIMVGRNIAVADVSCNGMSVTRCGSNPQAPSPVKDGGTPLEHDRFIRR